MDTPRLTTSLIAFVWAQDVTSALGAGKTGLAYNTAGLTCYYMRNKGAAAVAVTLVNMTLGTWVSGGFKEIDATHMPGLYVFGVPDAALAIGSDGSSCAMIVFTGVAGIHFMPLRIDLVRYALTGAGAIAFTYSLTSTGDGSPIADADVWVTTDNAGENVVASGTTNNNGQMTFYLDAGTYYVWRQKSGWNFINPDTEVVA